MNQNIRDKLITFREAMLEQPNEVTPAMVVGFINNILADNDEGVLHRDNTDYSGCPNPDDEGGG